MNYWHIQLHPNNNKTITKDIVIRILQEKSVIGIDEWDNGHDIVQQFKNEMKIGDIVAVKDGSSPIALVKIIGDYWFEKSVTTNFDWFSHRRKVKILDFYKSNYNFTIPHSRGTLTICRDLNTETAKIIMQWYQSIINKHLMEKIKLSTDKQAQIKVLWQEFKNNPKEQKRSEGINQLLEEWKQYREKIINNSLTLDEYTNTLDSKTATMPGGYLCNFLERTTSNILGSSKPGNANNFEIKLNNDNETYFIKNINKPNADRQEAEIYFNNNIKQLLKNIVSTSNPLEKIRLIKETTYSAKQILMKMALLDNLSDFIYIYSNDVLVKLFNMFIDTDSDIKDTFLINHQVCTVTMKILDIKENNQNELILLSNFLWKLANTNNIVVVNHPLNTIFYGPPGTGKTYNTILRAAEIAENRTIKSYDDALEIFKEKLHDQIEFITFHQNYSYEDFIQGLRPDTENEKDLIFERKDGVFKILADRALRNLLNSEKTHLTKKSFDDAFDKFIEPMVDGEKEEIEVKMKRVSFFITNINKNSIDFRKASGGTSHTLSIATLRKIYDKETTPDRHGLNVYYGPLLEELLKIGKDLASKNDKVEKKNYVIIIDEINRANISRVFGELITLLEPDKRSHGKIPLEVQLPSGESFIVPSNLFIIGTMNTADKSIALLDIALRRRFEFESMYPKYEIEGQEIHDVEILKNINEEIIKTKGYDFQIGHAYFMDENEDLIQRMNKKVIPLLLEYYINDEKEVRRILKSAGLKVEENSWPLKIEGKND